MHYKISLFFISLYLIIAPFIILPGLGFYDSKRVFQLIIFIIFGVLTLLYYFKKKGENNYSFYKIFYYNKLVTILIIILVLTGFISVLFSNKIEYSLLEYIFFLLLLSGIFLLIPVTLREHYRLGQLVFVTVALYSGLYLIIFFGNYISSFYNQFIPLWPDRLPYSVIVDEIEFTGKEVLYFVHRRFFNHTQTWTLPILMGLFILYVNRKPKDRTLHILLFLLISFWWMLILASGARGSIVSLISALLVITVFFGSTVKHFLKHTFSTLSIGGLLYFLLFRIFTSDQIPFMRTSDSGRLRMWERATELWLQEPVFGIGPLHYAYIINSAPYFSHPHNFYIQFLTEWGLIAFLTVIVLLFLAGRMIIRNYSQVHRTSINQGIYIAFVWSMVAGLIHASLSGVMHTPMSQVWFIVIGAWLLGYIRYQKPDKRLSINCKYRVNIIFVILLGIVLFLTIPDIIILSDRYTEYLSKYPGSSFYSRFWEQGLFD